MQLTTLLHVLAFLVPVAVLLLLNILGIEPSKPLEAALGSLGGGAAVFSVFGYAKDRLALKQTGTSVVRRRRARRDPHAEPPTVDLRHEDDDIPRSGGVR